MLHVHGHIQHRVVQAFVIVAVASVVFGWMIVVVAAAVESWYDGSYWRW